MVASDWALSRDIYHIKETIRVKLVHLAAQPPAALHVPTTHRGLKFVGPSRRMGVKQRERSANSLLRTMDYRNPALTNLLCMKLLRQA